VGATDVREHRMRVAAVLLLHDHRQLLQGEQAGGGRVHPTTGRRKAVSVGRDETIVCFQIMVRTEDGLRLVPELYSVPAECVAAEYKEPGTQQRVALGHCPFLWAQSLYIVGKLLQEGFLAPGELDPLNRRLCSEKKPDVVVQVVILAEDNEIRDKLAEHDIVVQTITEVAPIEVQPARVLSHLYTYLGTSRNHPFERS
jgi:hypothetical protein